MTGISWTAWSAGFSAFEGDGKLQQYEGGFTDYQVAKAEREAKLAESTAENPAAVKKSAG